MIDDPASLEIWNHRLAEIAEEMGLALERAALSPNIKERHDCSAALFTADGRLAAQAADIPVHLGSMPLSVQAVIERLPDLAEGQAAIVNDPYAGGTHLPDVTLVEPVFSAGRRIGWVANRAHHADVGGVTPGSMPVGVRPLGDALPEAPPVPPAVGPRYLGFAAPPALAYRPVTIDEEGVRIAPTLATDEVLARFAAACRAPDERRGDLEAQRAALAIGRRRLVALVERHSAEEVAARETALIAYAARLMRAEIAAIPDGVYAFADSLDDDGAGTEDVAIRVTVTISGERAIVDFSDSDPETAGPVNAVAAVTLSAVIYAFRLLLPVEAPTNQGLYEPIEVIAPEGTVVNARPPRAVGAGNVETSQRIVDVVLGALSQALPDRIPAASAGTMTNLLLGAPAGAEPAWAYYETIGGGAGGSPAGRGASGIQTHMTNTLNTPIEALEHALPVRVRRYALRRGSGGGGVNRGGDGMVRELELTASTEVTLIGDRRRRPPYGLSGGGPGVVGEDTLRRGDRVVRLPGKVSFRALAGDVITLATPGGGGFGDALKKRFWASVLSGEPLELD